jgi:hypothetical protein
MGIFQRSCLARREVLPRMLNLINTDGGPLQASRNTMTIVSADAVYFYDGVNHVVMSLVWLVLTNIKIPAIIATLVCLQSMKFFLCIGFGKSKMFFGREIHSLYMMGLGQGNRLAPPSSV